MRWDEERRRWVEPLPGTPSPARPVSEGYPPLGEPGEVIPTSGVDDLFPDGAGMIEILGRPDGWFRRVSDKINGRKTVVSVERIERP